MLSSDTILCLQVVLFFSPCVIMISFLYNVGYCMNIQKSIQDFNESYTLITCQASQKTLSNNWIATASNSTFAKKCRTNLQHNGICPCPKKLCFLTKEFNCLQQVLFVYLFLLAFLPAYSKDCCNWKPNFNILMGTESLYTSLYFMTPVSLSKLDYMICKSILIP